MADFGGIDITTPQEILQRISEQGAQIQAIQDPRARRNANIYHQMSNMFKPRELRRAESAMKIMKNIDKRLSESGLEPTSDEYQEQRYNQMYKKLAELDPQAAAQAMVGLRQVQNQRFERDRLKQITDIQQQNADVATARVGMDLEKHDAMAPFRDSIWMMKPGTFGEKGSDWEYVNMKEDEGAAAKLKALKDAGYTMFNYEDVAGLIGAPRTNAYNASRDMFMSSRSQEDARQQVAAATSTLDKMGGILEVLANSPGANSGVAAFQTYMTGLGTEAEQFLRAKNDIIWQRGYSVEAAKMDLKDLWDASALEDVISQQQFESLSLNMSYTLARMLDPSGRLSDADVMFAGQMIGKYIKNPETIAAVMTNLVGANHGANIELGDHMEAMLAGVPENMWSRRDGLYLRTHRRYKDAVERYRRNAISSGYMTPEQFDQYFDPEYNVRADAPPPSVVNRREQQREARRNAYTGGQDTTVNPETGERPRINFLQNGRDSRRKK